MKDLLRASYDRSAAGYDARFRDLQRVKYASLLGARADALGPFIAEGGRVLDLGCGTGLLEEWLRDVGAAPRATFVGLDLSHAMLAGASERLRARVQGDSERQPFRDGSFAAAAAFTVLGILPGSPARALAELRRVLAPGGALFVSVLGEIAGGPSAFRAELGAAGFLVRASCACGQDVGFACARR